MQEDIELAVETPQGTADCRLEHKEEGIHAYSATILYPNMVNGYNRSEIYCFTVVYDPKTKTSVFESMEDSIPAKIQQLEPHISAAIIKSLAGNR
jgi:hypothetical protein